MNFVFLFRMADHLSAHFCSSVFKPEPESKIYELIKPDFEDKAIFIDLSLFLKILNNLIFFSTISKLKPRQPFLYKLYVSEPFIG